MASQAISEQPTVISAELRKELRQELRDAGVFERMPLRSWLKLLVLLTATLVICLVALKGNLPFGWLLIPIAAIPLTSAAMLGHEGAHKSFAADGRNNAWMLHLTFPLMTGLGAHHWKWKHNLLHHEHPNVPGRDFDLQMWPMACHALEYRRAGPARKWFIRHAQWLVFWPISSLMPYAMRLNSIRILLRRVKDPGIDKAWLLDAGCLAVHYTCWLVIPSFFLPFGTVLLFYCVLWSLVGLYLAAIFAPAHMGMAIQTEHADDWLGQLQTGRNLLMPRWMSWFFIGLDYQVEHHLFPGIPHQNFPKAAEITKAWAQRHDLPYHEIGYGAGLVDATRFLARAWSVEVVETAAVAAAT